jgi:sec-independent protein translocase protein TatC
MALVPFPGPQYQGAYGIAPEASEPDVEPAAEGQMSFLEHLDELRKRILRSCIAIAFGVVATFWFIQPIFNFILAPTRRVLPPGVKLIYTQPGEAFSLYVTVALISGILVASPFISYQVWMFIAPGLYQHEKKLAIPFVVLSSFFFVLGAAFSHYVVFPMTWRFFVGFTTDYLTFMPRIAPAFGMYLKLLLGMGLVFQMPTLVLFLARMGVLTARFMVKNFKYAFLIIFVVAALLTPGGDPMSQAAMAAPMLVLYLISIMLAWLFGKKKRVEEDEPLAD